MTKQKDKLSSRHPWYSLCQRLCLYIGIALCMANLPFHLLSKPASKPLPNQSVPPHPLSTHESLQHAVTAIPLRDPTRPPDFLLQPIISHASVTWQQSGIVLTAIYHYPHRTFALINGKVAMVGETINGFKITRITSDAVWFLGADNDAHVLRLFLPIKN